MALIGARRFGAGDFGAPPISGVPLALGAQAVPALDYPPTEVPDVPIAPKKPGINWLGVLADALSGAAGQPGMYAQRMYQQQHDQSDFERGEQTWQSHHKQDLADQMQLLDYKRLHPDDELNRQLDAAGITDPATRADYARRALNKSTNDDPYVITPLPGGSFYTGPRSGLAAALTGGSSASPMSDNVPMVSDPASYNALPPGARFKTPDGHIRVKGGQTQPASGNFR